MKDFFNNILRNGPFVVSLVAIIIAGVLGIVKGVDINNLLPAILGLYLGQKASTAVSAHWASVKDVDSDTNQVIKDTEGITVGGAKDSKANDKSNEEESK